VIVQGDKVEEILGETEEKLATENEIRESVRRGTRPLEAYERYGPCLTTQDQPSCGAARRLSAPFSATARAGPAGSGR
jgi:hypothetical protein